MRLSRSDSVVKRRKEHKLRNRYKGKKKHKRLDAICENAYARSRREVEKVESVELNHEESQFEVRRSNRARKAPVLLDSSPQPPKKRRKVDRGVTSSVEKIREGDKAQHETQSSSSRGLNGDWGLRLRSRGRSQGSSRRVRGRSSLKGKRKLFDDFDGSKDGVEPQSYDKEKDEVGEKSTVVRSKRPGRIKASNVSANENQGVDFGVEVEDGQEKNGHKALEVMDEVDGVQLEVKLECRNRDGAEDCDVTSKLAERQDTLDGREETRVGREDTLDRTEETLDGREDTVAVREETVTEGEETAVEKDSKLNECHSNGNVETGEEHVELERLECDLVSDQRNAAEVDYTIGEQAKDERHTDGHLYDETLKKLKGKYNSSAVANGKSRIKLGRCCGLCGGGTDGKPPKILLLEGAGSDNEAYSGSSSSEEPNYDIWDGFGDQSGWLGRLLGPINDRFGIAGIWVHQQCAVWSPEVYFAGLGCLKNVRAALYRGRVLKCSRCRRPGATIGCRVDRCPKTYHLPCARAKGCIFDHRKFLIACTDHRHLFQPYGVHNAHHLKKLKAKKLKLELRKMANEACRKDIETEEKWLENCGEDEEFLKRESKRLHRDLGRIAPTFIGGTNAETEKQFQGWESVAGLQDVIRCMKEVVILPLLYPEFFSNLRLTPPRGVLLHGYPGTGKTLVVRALVGSCARGDRRIAYFARKGADCLGKYVGDAERQLRLLFQVAEKSQPSIIFFDEIDGLAPCRTKQQDQTHNSVVSTLLALMDGLKSRGSVIVIGATNRPDSVDAALRRPGRFDREIYFPLPSGKDREAILSLHTKKWPKPITGSLLKWVATRTVGFAGADLQALCTQAAIISLRRSFPLQEVLSAAETRASNSKCPSIPSFAVEERDWLKALSCAPPPCSRRESGVALNDVVCTPLEIYLVPCLLLPLMRFLVSMHMDERIWLPPHLSEASKLVKNVILSALSSKGVQSDNWWLRIDGLLEEVDVTNEIVNKLLLANVLVGESNLSGSIEIEDNSDESGSKFIPSKLIGARPGLLQNISSTGSESGFQVLICGNPRSGQRHLASCLLHCFVGNVDIWKVDLATISHEGHGDMIHGLTRILMRCASTNLCMLYLPTIDLWAIETCEISEDNCVSSSIEPQSSRNISCGELDAESSLCPSADVEVKKASYLWTSFIEQLESIRVNTSLIVLATSELPLSLLPSRIRQFFGNELLNWSLSGPLEHKAPQFSLQLDGKFDLDKVINSCAAKLSKDLVQHYVQSLHVGNHNNEKLKSFTEEAHETVESNVEQVSHSNSIPVITNKALKGKSSLQLAISTVGYQMLCYPHFAELCWVTSKLKEGPSADPSGPWKGWPFNSCIVRPVNSMDKVGLVRGLVAVGLSAYRGEYTSLRQVCSEVRKVLEALVGLIDDKIQAGKDRSQFVRILSQVAYLEDMVSSWAHALQSLEVDNPISEVNSNICSGSVDNHLSKDPVIEGDGQLDVSDVNGHNQHPDSINEVADTVEVNKVALDDSCSLKHDFAPNEPNSEPAESSENHAKLGQIASEKFSNGFTENSSNHPDDPLGSGNNNHEIKHNGSSSTHDIILSKDTTENSAASNLDSTSDDANVFCFYKCCSECFVNLQNLLLKIINTKLGLKEGDSTVEDFHDLVASLSANLHLSLSKISQDQNEGGWNRKYCECKNFDKFLVKECGCHETSKSVSNEETFPGISQSVDDCVFVFKDGVMTTLDTGSDVSYHCKFEKLCLCFVTEWLAMREEAFG